jgi:hypothetical protein
MLKGANASLITSTRTLFGFFRVEERFLFKNLLKIQTDFSEQNLLNPEKNSTQPTFVFYNRGKKSAQNDKIRSISWDFGITFGRWEASLEGSSS